MGINCSPLKSIVILKESDRKRSDGSAVIENAIQVLGRAIRPNCGISIKEFYDNYDGNLDNIEFPKEMNEMSFYMYDTPMWRAAYDYFKNNLASIQKHCPTCTCYDQKTQNTNIRLVYKMASVIYTNSWNDVKNNSRIYVS